MNSVAALTGRNLRLFFRDRAGVFFSLLSALILVGLYVLFLGNLQVDNLTESLPTAAPDDIRWFVTSWVFAGITMIVTVTTPLAALSVFVDDRASGRFSDFVVTPVRRSELILGYLLSSFVISVTMTTTVFIVGQGYMLTQGHPGLDADQIVNALLRMALSSLAYAALSSFVVTFIRTSGAFAALSTVVGTIIGFLAGAYIPAGTLPSGVVQALNALPFAQAAMLIRQPVTAPALHAVTGGESRAVEAVSTFYGVTAHVGDVEVTAALAIASLVGVAVVFTALGAWRLSVRIR